MSTRITKALLRDVATEMSGGAEPAPDRTVFDAEVRGFGVRFRWLSAPAFFFRWETPGGQRRRLGLGTPTETTIEEAREAARGLRAIVRAGGDPAETRRKAAAGETVTDLAARYMLEYATPHKKAGSARNDETLWRLHILPLHGRLRVADLDAEHVHALKTKLHRTPAKANAALALLSTALNLAEMWKLRPQNSNPCRFVEKYRASKRERILTPEELGRLGAALTKHESDCLAVVVLVRALLFTGAREDELMKAKATQLDPRRGILILPDSKGGQDVINLSEEALHHLIAIGFPGNPWLIPGPFPGQPIRSPWRAWRRICETAGLADFRLHDLRHVFGSYSHHYGASQRTIATILRHKQLSTTERYTQGMDAEARAAANTTANGIRDLLKG